MKYALCAALALVGCAQPASETASSSSDVIVDGPMTLRGSCSISGGQPITFIGDLSGEAGANLGRIGPMDGAGVLATLSASGAEYVVTMRTARWHMWEMGLHTSVEVTKDHLKKGDTITLEDSSLIRDRVVSCTASLVPQPTQHAIGIRSIDLTELSTPRFTMDVPLPNRLVCGLELRLTTALPAYAASRFTEAFDLSPEIVVAQKDDKTLSLTFPNEQDWDFMLTMESKHRDVPVASTLRSTLWQADEGSFGTLEPVRCATEDGAP